MSECNWLTTRCGLKIVGSKSIEEISPNIFYFVLHSLFVCPMWRSEIFFFNLVLRYKRCVHLGAIQ